MPTLKPFRGYRYNSKKVGSLGSVLAPPYDVISKKEQSRLYALSPYNFVRIDLKKKKRGRNPYRDAAGELKRWIEEKAFLQEKDKALYIYVQGYRNPSGKRAERIGFISLMDVNPRFVKPHEHTLAAPKKDRIRLLSRLQANMSPIFGLYEDSHGRIRRWLKASTRKRPVLDVRLKGVHHRLYAEHGAKRIQAITQALKSKPMYIADGHHRFGVSLDYHRSHARNNGTEASRYCMTYLCDVNRNDMDIYPTHRLFRDLDSSWVERLEPVIRRYFKSDCHRSLNSLTRSLERRPKGRIAIGLVSGLAGKGFVQLTLKRKVRDVDVRVAHRYLVPSLLRGQEVRRSQKISFTRDARQIVRAVRGKKNALGLLMSKMRIQDMMRLSKAGIMLPQKSTYFYPKLLSGLVFYRF